MLKRIIIAITLLALSGCCIQTYRLECYRSELKLTRVELANAREQQQSIAITVDSIRSSVERTGEVLSESVSTIKDLRRQMQEVRKEYENLENLLLDYNSSNSCDSNIFGED